MSVMLGVLGDSYRRQLRKSQERPKVDIVIDKVAAVAAFISPDAKKWSKCAWVCRIFVTVSPRSCTSRRIRSAAPPGSTTMASLVTGSPRIEQLQPSGGTANVFRMSSVIAKGSFSMLTRRPFGCN